ncbi:hypothetical protein UFOVP190_92 [uncultured Caudovirales phage]|uniref:Glycine-rich domain-containing protein n=1 Tax=uncultured Caudovirales phage TaxID=2100421 RepID=A0A6J7WJX6_9CAUD|nr:hypothetical protein UFOVP190_92 [uncultured Caudovirales phage]
MTTTVGGSTGITVSTWSNAARPSGVSMGTLGWNTDMSTLEVHNGTTWGNVGAGGSSTGGGITWATVQTANITAVVNTAYPVDATTSNITVTLPATPTAGSQVIITDYKQALSASKTITVYPNGGKIYGNTGNATLNNFGQSINLTYIDSTQGWIMPSGVQIGFLTNYSITYMIVAGGGGGGSDMGGGGGAGGYIASTAYVTPGLTYSITVGAGGSGAPAGTYQVRGFSGSDSTIGRLAITSIGGGGGGTEYGGGSYQAGASGGSGGGAAGGTASGGSGTAGQGNAGGNGGGSWYMGGGGGAGGAGAGGGATATGGTGIQNAILGTNYYWCGGGGGAGYSINGGPGGAGGGGGGAVGSTSGGSGINAGSPGGGGSTSSQTNTPGGNAGQYTGGGGGGGSHYNSNNYGGSGGSGIVVITYTGQQRGTGGTVSTVNGNTVHAFYGSGTFTA